MTWQPISTVPKDRRVIVWTGQQQYAAHWAQNPFTGDIAFVVGHFGDEGDQLILKDVTKWHELPKNPKDEDKIGGI